MYSIANLCPNVEHQPGGYGFIIKLYPPFREIVAASDLTQSEVDCGIASMGREWLDACGYSRMYDPDNAGFGCDERKPLGPNARPLHEPRSIRVKWGEWGPEHISVPGNACGLDIDRGIGAPYGGRVLLPHNIDCWSQVNLILIVFTWFADVMMLGWELKEGRKSTGQVKK